MEKEEKNQREFTAKPQETDLFLQWGNRKRVRCVRVRDQNHMSHPSSSTPRVRRKITTRFITFVSPLQSSTHFPTRSSQTATLRSEGNRTSSSPDKDERFYTTRGSMVGLDENGKVSVDGVADREGDENRRLVWPELYFTLSSKEKEEDFMAMKGCKLPQRPKKRAKVIQRTLLLVSPGAWLTDMCQERYEVREKKNSKKRLRGLKALGNMDSDSE